MALGPRGLLPTDAVQSTGVASSDRVRLVVGANAVADGAISE